MRITVALAALLMSSAAALADDMQDCKSSDPAQAIGGCSLVLQSKALAKPAQINALGYRAQAYSRKGQMDLAHADLKRLLEIEPNNVFAIGFRGELHLRANRFDRALADFSAALKIQPGHVNSLANRGYVYLM